MRCNSGHYFAGRRFDDEERLGGRFRCPFDAWSMDGFLDAIEAFERLPKATQPPSPHDITSRSSVLERLLIVQFGDPRRAFRAVVPMMYIDKGNVHLFDDIPPNLL
jgi:hypothetical protein